ncbi:MAG: hypothetical protein ACUVR0_08965 [Candidatus Aminicenantales bacterium]
MKRGVIFLLSLAIISAGFAQFISGPKAQKKYEYLGRLSSNSFDPESVSNPYGRYGSPYSADSINNPSGKYGSPYSLYGVSNPYILKAPKIYASTGISTLTLPRLRNNLPEWPDK